MLNMPSGTPAIEHRLWGRVDHHGRTQLVRREVALGRQPTALARMVRAQSTSLPAKPPSAKTNRIGLVS